MARLLFTANLQHHISAPEAQQAGGTLGEVLEMYFQDHPQVRSYVVDDQGALRQHVIIFIDGEQARDRRGLSDEVESGSEIYVMQALSGG